MLYQQGGGITLLGLKKKKKKSRMKVESQYGPASANFGLQMPAFWNSNACL